jgi:hypothetical protein
VGAGRAAQERPSTPPAEGALASIAAGTGGGEFPVPFRTFAGEHYFGIFGSVPENAFGRSLPQQLSHLVGEFFDTVAEEVRRGSEEILEPRRVSGSPVSVVDSRALYSASSPASRISAWMPS